MDFDNINFEEKQEIGFIPNNKNYNHDKLISGSFGNIYVHTKIEDENKKTIQSNNDYETIIEKRFLQTRNDFILNQGVIFISFIKEVFIQKILNKYFEDKITTKLLGYNLHYEFIDNVSMNEKLSIYNNYIENDMRDLSGSDLMKENIVVIIKKLLKILSKIHSIGIVHLDIKPGNFLINDETLDLHIIDFGVSRIQNSTFNCKVNCSQKLYTQPYRSFKNINYIQKFKCVPVCNHNIDLRKEDIFALGPMIYELFKGVDEYFVDIDDDKNERKRHHKYFKEGKFMKKYRKFVNKLSEYVIETKQIKDDELDEFRKLIFMFVCDIPGNDIKYDEKVMSKYGYDLVELDIYNDEELEFIRLLQYDDLRKKHFTKIYENTKIYNYDLLKHFTKLCS